MKKSIEINYSGIKLTGSAKFKSASSNGGGAHESPSSLPPVQLTNGAAKHHHQTLATASAADQSAAANGNGNKKLIFKSKASNSTSLLTAINSLAPTAASPVVSKSSSQVTTRLRLKRTHSATTSDDEDDVDSARSNKATTVVNGNGSPSKPGGAVRSSPRHSPSKPATVSPTGKTAPPVPASKSSNKVKLTRTDLNGCDDEDEEEDEKLFKLNSKLVKTTTTTSVAPVVKSPPCEQTRSTRSTRLSSSPNKPSPDKQEQRPAVKPAAAVSPQSSVPSPAASSKPFHLAVKKNVLSDDDEDEEEEYRQSRFAKLNVSNLFSQSRAAAVDLSRPVSSPAQASIKMPPSVSSDSGRSDEERSAASKTALKRKIFSTRVTDSSFKPRSHVQSFEVNFDCDIGSGQASAADHNDSSSKNAADHSKQQSSVFKNLISQPRRSSSSSTGAAVFGQLNQSLLLEDDDDEEEDGDDHHSTKSGGPSSDTVVTSKSGSDGHHHHQFKKPAVKLFQDDDADGFSDDDDDDDQLDEEDADDVVMLANSRQAYECEELGETQAFADDLFYLMDGLRSDKFSIAQRCLSAIKLAEQCLSSEFRMHLRSSHGTLAKIFSLLKDSPSNHSLALCTSSILFALSRDKLAIELDKSILKLMIDIMNMPGLSSDQEPSTKPQTPKLLFSSRKASTSSASGQDAAADLYPKTLKRCRELCDRLISDSLQNKQKQQQQAVSSSNPTSATTSPNGAHRTPRLSSDAPAAVDAAAATGDPDLTPSHFDLNTSELSAQLLAMECLLNLTINKRASEWLRDELRLLGAFENVLVELRTSLERLKTLQSHRVKSPPTSRSSKTSVAEPPPNRDEFYLINKFTRCLNLLENLTQTTTFGSSYALITASLRSTNPSSYPNHSYLVDYKDTYLRDLIKDSFGFFFAELSRTGHLLTTSTDHTDPASKQHVFKRQLASAAIKEIFMLMVNLTHANVECTKKLLDDRHLSDQVLIFIHKIAVHLTDSDRFDISVLALIVLINMFVIDWNLFKASDDLSSDPGLKKDKLLKPRSPFLLKEINCRDLEPIDSFEIVLKLYETKEALLSVAETDQENELMQLNEQINSQNVENINMTVMNSIHKAGKHMEHHIIAAHAAMLLAYFLMSRHKLKEAMTYSLTSASSVDRTGKQLLEGFDLARVKSRMKDESFENMIEIIKKFLSFMKIMKVSGFSADEHMEEIIEFLQSS